VRLRLASFICLSRSHASKGTEPERHGRMVHSRGTSEGVSRDGRTRVPGPLCHQSPQSPARARVHALGVNHYISRDLVGIRAPACLRLTRPALPPVYILYAQRWGLTTRSPHSVPLASSSRSDQTMPLLPPISSHMGPLLLPRRVSVSSNVTDR
jgi:hypothetical protein